MSTILPWVLILLRLNILELRKKSFITATDKSWGNLLGRNIEEIKILKYLNNAGQFLKRFLKYVI